MRTLYIDIYFLINFTVDFLALYFAALFSKTWYSAKRLIFAATIGGLSACMIVLISENAIFRLIISFLTLGIMALISAKKATLTRRIKFTAALLLFMVIIGGLVYCMFLVFERYLPTQETQAPRSRNLLLLSILILLSIGIIKLFMSLFNNGAIEKNVKIRVDFMGASLECEALVDTGNLLRDPIDQTPVMLLKKSSAEALFPFGIPKSFDGELPLKYKKHLRLIPYEKGGVCGVYIGIRPDSVVAFKAHKSEAVKVIIVIDDEEGSFGGYVALMPGAALADF